MLSITCIANIIKAVVEPQIQEGKPMSSKDKHGLNIQWAVTLETILKPRNNAIHNLNQEIYLQSIIIDMEWRIKEQTKCVGTRKVQKECIVEHRQCLPPPSIIKYNVDAAVNPSIPP